MFKPILLALGLSFGVSSAAQSPSGATTAGDIYRKAAPAVVLIETYGADGKVSSEGSGFLISADGRILTNYHVIAHTKQATVRLANKDAFDDVQVLDVDKRKDVALIKIKAVELPYLALGRSSDVQVGDTVFALGNPLGLLRNTLSQGIVSGIRPGDGYRYFQISAPISQGSSGGPIFNANGEVIGIAWATLDEGQNLNFAIPVDYARGMLSANQLQPLASIYEPEPAKPDDTANRADGKARPAAAASEAKPPVSTPVVSDGMKSNSIQYVESKLFAWTEDDARRELGEPTRRRERRDRHNIVDGDIYSYPDPTRLVRNFELFFNVRTKRLETVYVFPWNLTWDGAKKMWGDKVTIIKNPDGTRFYAYKDRHLELLVDRNGRVINFWVY